MYKSSETTVLLLLVFCVNSLSGLDIPQPEGLRVNIADGAVTVYWARPVNAPSDFKYNVQTKTHVGNWSSVDSCTGITRAFCNLSSLIPTYSNAYRVRVQLVSGDDTSQWTMKKFSLDLSELLPPSFALSTTSSTLSVFVHPKPILKQIFLYGVTYTIYLQEAGKEKTTTAYLVDDIGEERIQIFNSLQWGTEYCVSMKVTAITARRSSPVSPRQCVLLPEREWFVTTVWCLSVLGVLAIAAIGVAILQCYLGRPEKTPASLKSPPSHWSPLSVREGVMEVVTDKGWFLSSNRTGVDHPLTHVTVTEDNEESRRTSMDSGVIAAPGSDADDQSPLMRHDDSGCGSLGGAESATSSQREYPLQDEQGDAGKVRKREDSGVGLGSSTMNLDGQDSGLLKGSAAGGSYRTQSPPAVRLCVCDGDEQELTQIPRDSGLANVVTGYRAGPQLCICSGAGQCTWCHQQGQCGSEVVREHMPQMSQRGFVDSYKTGHMFSSYGKKSQLDTVMVDDFTNTFTRLEDTFPLLTTLSQLPLGDGGPDVNMNHMPLSLTDVLLTTD